MSTSDDSRSIDEEGALAPVDEQTHAVTPALAPTDAVVDAWFNQFINDSVVSRHTEIFNYMREAVGHLKQQLAG